MTTEETAYKSHLEALGAANAAASADRVLTGNPQGTPETNFETYHSGLADDAARAFSEEEICGGIIDDTVVPEGDHDSWVDQFDNVVGVPFTNQETLFSICRKRKPQI